MTAYRQSALCLIMLGVGCLSGCFPTDGSSEPPETDAATVIPPAAVTKALTGLEVLEDPSQPRCHTNEPPFPTKMYLPDDYYADCPDAIDLLSKTPFDVDPELLQLAQADKPLPVRCRAISILTKRSDRAAVPILDRMSSAADDNERYVAWVVYRKAIEENRLPPPSDYSAILTLYKKESDKEVHEQLASFLGTARAKEAVPVLLETLQTDPGDVYVISALGQIGDAAAAPALIAAYAQESHNRHVLCLALGRLATPRAVDFLIAHLDQYGAVEAWRIRKAQALPALQQRLDKLTHESQRKDLDFAVTKIAVTKLSYQHPAEPLLALAEDRTNNDWLRHDALMLRDYAVPALHPRLLPYFVTIRTWRLNCSACRS